MKMIIRSIKSLFGNTHPLEIGMAIAFGTLLGLVPPGNLTWFGVFFLTLFIKSNLGAQGLTILGVSVLATFLDPTLNALGLWILEDLGLRTALVPLFSLPILPWFQWNNTLVIGGLALGTVLLLPLSLIGAFFVQLLRKTILPSFYKSPLVQGFLKLPLVRNVVHLWSSVSGGTHE